MSRYSVYQFSIFRIFIGFGLIIYFLSISPYAPELSIRTVYGIPFSLLKIQSPILLLTKETSIRYGILISTLISIMITFGIFRKTLSALLLFFSICITSAIPILPTPLDGFMPFVLLLCIIVPNGDLQSMFTRKEFNIPKYITTISRYGFGFSIFICCIFTVITSYIRLSPNLFLIFLLYIISAAFFLFRKTHIYAWIVLFILFLFFPITNTLPAYFFSIGAVIFCLNPMSSFLISSSANRVVYIDGECILCHGFAKFLLTEDIQKNFQLASLQGNFAKTNLPATLNNKLNTVIYYDGQSFFTESSAVLRIIGGLGGIWIISYLFLLVPNFLRDILYRLVAKFRYQIFGKLEICALPSSEDKNRVLD